MSFFQLLINSFVIAAIMFVFLNAFVNKYGAICPEHQIPVLVWGLGIYCVEATPVDKE